MKKAIEAFNTWMDESLDYRCCMGLAAIALGFWANLLRMWLTS